MWKHIFLTAAGLALAAALGGAALVYGGLYNVAATAPHTQLVYSLLEKAMHESVKLRARGIEPPPLDAAATLQRGALCFREHCEQCHGAPGVAPDAIGKGMQPNPGSLVGAASYWRARELYWITRHGLKMTGMPAWEFRLSDPDLWALVGFVKRLPYLSPAAYDEQMAPLRDRQCKAGAEALVATVAAGDADRGRVALRQYACTSCHIIPGVAGPDVHVGPPLDRLASRQWLAGELPNTTANLIAWIRHPQRIDPLTAMPDMNVTPQHAQDMAAYLGTLN